jgi:transposase
MAELFWFSDEQWVRIVPLLPTNTRGLKRVDDHRVLSGIVHVIRTGCRWCDCPAEYGPAKTIYNRFVRWARRGIWERIFTELAKCLGQPERLLIDSTIIRAHRTASGGKGGPSSRPSVAASAAGPPRSTS